ncbi:MAG: acyl-CoA dehydrogenase family protein, partial [Myxococcota bacterium]
GRPLADFQVVEGHLARMASTAWAMEALVAHVGRLEGEGRPIAVPSAAAKVFCSEGAFDLCDRAVQLHGALGFVEDTGMALLLRDCRVTRIFEGANDVLCVRIGTALATGAPDTERLVHGPGSVDPEPHREWMTANARLDALVDEARRRRGIALVRDQRWLAWLGQAHLALHAASASLATAGPGADAIARGTHACKTFVRRAHEALDRLTHAPDDTARDAALMEILR